MQGDDYGWPEIYPREHSNLIAKSELEKYPWIFKCGAKNCYWTTAHETKEHAQETRDKHPCGQELSKMPRSNGSDLHTGYAAPSIVERIWGHLDEATKVVMETRAKQKAGATLDQSEEKIFNEARGNARGLAIAIFEYSEGTNFFENTDAVAKLAVARYTATKKGEDLPPTPGIGDCNPHRDLTVAKIREREAAEAELRGTPAPAAKKDITVPDDGQFRNKTGKALTEADINGILQGAKVGLPAESLMKVYKMTRETYDKIVATVSAE